MTRCRVTWQNYVRNYFKRLRDPLVTHYHISCLPSLFSCLPSPFSSLPSIIYHLPSPISCLPSIVSCLSSTVSRLSSSSPPSPLYPSPLETQVWRGEIGRQQAWRMTTGQEGANLTARKSGGWPRWKERGEFEKGWRMTPNGDYAGKKHRVDAWCVYKNTWRGSAWRGYKNMMHAQL